MTEISIMENTKKKKRTRTKTITELVEVTTDDSGEVIYKKLPMPKDTKSTSRADIFTAIKKEAESGNRIYDDKTLAVINYTKPKTLKTKNIVKTTFE